MLFYIKPRLLGSAGLGDTELREDRIGCVECGPCGVGRKALYLNTYFLDRWYYIPAESVKRAYKRVALSRGAVTGKGIFGSIPYLVVEYGRGETKVCSFRDENHVDEMIAIIRVRFPHIKTMSESAARRMAEELAAEEAKYRKNLSATAKASVAELEKAKAFLEERPDLTTHLAVWSKDVRVDSLTNPNQKWVACTMFGLAAAAAAYGVWSYMYFPEDWGTLVTVGGFTLIFLFAAMRVMPTVRGNRKALRRLLEETREKLADYIADYPGFPVPARYAHPATLSRMIRSIRQGRSETVPESFEDMKKVLKSLNNTVTVSQIEYDEVKAIKPMFLLEDYR